MSYTCVDLFGNIKTISIFDRDPKFRTPNMLRKAAMMTSKRQDWTTPIWLYEELKRERNITDNYDTDPATNQSNPLGCKHFYTEKEDGIMQPWYGKVFINPPFTGYYNGKIVNLTSLWIKEAYYRVYHSTDNIDFVTMLIPARTDTRAFHKYIYKQPNVKLEFIKGRIKFGNSKISAPFPSMVVDFYRQNGNDD